MPAELPEEEAVRLGYESVTHPYADKECHLLRRVIADFANVACCLVKKAGGTELWRKPIKPIKEYNGLLAFKDASRGRPIPRPSKTRTY